MVNVFTLLGGWGNRSLIHFHVTAAGVHILHFANYDYSRASYSEESFCIFLNGKECKIFAENLYPVEFAREVWLHFLNLKFEGGRLPNNFAKYVPYTLPGSNANQVGSATYAMEA